MTMINEVLDKFDSEINKLVDDAFNGNGFDYDDFLEMTGQMRNDYSIRFFLQSDLCNDILDYLQEHNEDNDYDVIEAVSSEFAMRLEDKIDESIPYSNHRMIAKKNRILNRIAKTVDTDEPDANTSRSIMQGYNEYLSDGFSSRLTDNDTGVAGLFGYQFAGVGISEPYIYAREVYSISKKGKIISYLNEYKYDINGNIIDKKSEKHEDETWQNIRDTVGTTISSIIDEGTTIIPLQNVRTYNQAKQEVERLMKEKQIEL